MSRPPWGEHSRSAVGSPLPAASHDAAGTLSKSTQAPSQPSLWVNRLGFNLLPVLTPGVQAPPTTFRQLLEKFDDSAKTTAAKGNRFEKFCEAHFQTDPLWVERFDAVWLWMDRPGRDGQPDTGVDLVARERGTGH